MILPFLLLAASAPAAPACDKPVYLVISVDQFDRAKALPYAQAMRESGIVKRNGGSYRISGAPKQVLEGEWPAGRGFVVEHYPCHEAFERMWKSDEYQRKLKPLRAGTGNYTIALFDAVPGSPTP
jgi:uncharacterized protein (DUF1330 family)